MTLSLKNQSKMSKSRKRKEAIECQEFKEDHHKEEKKGQMNKNVADGSGTDKTELHMILEN